MNENFVEKVFKPVLGHPCWGLYHSRQLNLSMNFGKPSLRIREPIISKAKSARVQKQMSRRCVTVKGEWWLWIYLCYWRLSSKMELLATGSSSAKKVAEALAYLEGEKLISVKFDPHRGVTQFGFDLGATLECRPMTRDSLSKLWLFYQPDGNVVSAFADGTLTVIAQDDPLTNR
ncbi:MAG: hypothetical protein ACKVT0_08745 [Planctomycetaceae bacterium]